MKRSVMIMGCCLGLLTATAQHRNAKKPDEQIRQYWFVMLMKGPNRNQDSATAAHIQTARLANINRLYNEGKLKVAGPFGGDKWQGLFIFDVATKEEVEHLLNSDEAITSGRLIYDIQPWYTAPIGSFKPGVPKKKY